MGGRRGGQARARGADLRYNMEITLEEAFAGKQATIRVPGTAPCAACHGTGGEKGTQPVTCPTCRGHGKVRGDPGLLHHRAHLRQLRRPRQGDREAVPGLPRPGPHRARTRRCRSTIPAGVEDGTRIRLAGEGEAGMRGGAVGRSLHLPLDQAAPAVPARRRQRPLPRADLDDDRGARAAGSRSRPSTAPGPRCRCRPAPRPASSSASRARA